MPIDLNQFVPIDETNKAEMLEWLGQTLNYLNDNIQTWDGVVNLNTTNNRIFGTGRDDVDEIIDMFGQMFVTMRDYNFFKK